MSVPRPGLVDQLSPVLPEALRPRLGELIQAFEAEEASDDPVEVLAWLRDRGHIDEAVIRRVLLSLETRITVGAIEEGSSRFLRLGRLGAGAMGEVNLAHDRRLRRTVAVKRMSASIADDAALKARFVDEAQITAQLDHPGVIPVHGLRTRVDGTVEYAMKLIRGQNLDAYLETCRDAITARRALDEDHRLSARLELFLQVCNAMAYAHARGVLHRDLKPENIMLGAFHEVVVMDWGIAKCIGVPERAMSDALAPGADDGDTEYGIALGTPAYMSPEQAEGRNDELDAHSDQYSLGLILQEIVTLARAVSSKSSIHALMRAQTADRDPIKPFSREKIPRELKAIIAKATEEKPERRYPDVEALADDVRRYLRDESVLAAPDGLMGRLLRWIGRHRQLTLAFVLGLVASLLALVLVAVLVLVGVVEVSRQAAAAREATLGRISAAASRQATRIDGAFLRYEGLVRGLAGSTAEALARDPGDVKVYAAGDFADPATAPPDLRDSEIYDKASLDAPDVVLAVGLEAAPLALRQRQLASLQPALRDAITRSAGSDEPLPDADLRRSILDEGLPFVWSYVGTEEGLLAGYPGVGEYPDDYDMRTRPWYTESLAADGPVWSALDADESGLGLLLTCGVAVRDATGNKVGVAAADLTFGHVIDELLDPEALDIPVEAVLIDRDGNVVVRSSQKARARTATEYVPPPFEYPGIAAAIRGQPSGWVEVDGHVAAWSQLEIMDWTYVLVGDASDVLGWW